jgi:hypothetical protein
MAKKEFFDESVKNRIIKDSRDVLVCELQHELDPLKSVGPECMQVNLLGNFEI